MSAYKTNLPVSAAQLTAIGLVAAEWSYLESVVEAAIGNHAGIDDEDRTAAITTNLSWRPRLDMLVTLHKLQCDSLARSGFITRDDADQRIGEFKTITKELDALSSKRNQAVHARWVRGGHGSPGMISIVRARGGVTRETRALSENDLNATAQAIAQQSKKLIDYFEISQVDDGWTEDGQ